MTRRLEPSTASRHARICCRCHLCRVASLLTLGWTPPAHLRSYKNTVIAWRNKVEKDNDEVQQVHTTHANPNPNPEGHRTQKDIDEVLRVHTAYA